MPLLKKVKTEDAVGLVVGHDMTKTIPGVYDGPRFRRGDVIKKEDIPELLSMGKEHIYVIEKEEDQVHEEEAAIRIAKAIAGKNITTTAPRQGRVNLKATVDGIIKINKPLLYEIHSIEDIIIATRHNNVICKAGEIVAGTKIIPLFTPEDNLKKLEEICKDKGKVVDVIPFLPKKVGMIITGNEIFKGITEDKFAAVMRKKIEKLGSTVISEVIVPDDEDIIAKAILDMKAKGCDVIITCGGLSVDPDDVTVEGVEKSGARIISYGVPVMPGAMVLVAKLGDIPILGAPGAVIFKKTTIIDVLMPRMLAGDKITRQDIIELAHGGMCLDCEECVFPVCPFGK
jgi:molybdenum cofactor synthesis domain-containing protein